MKKILTAALLALFFVCATARAGTYFDNQYKFQIALPENWTVADKSKFDQKSLLELYRNDSSPGGKTLISISAAPAQSGRPDFSFANMTEEEKRGLFADKLAKIKDKLPANSTLDSQVTDSWATNSFLVVSLTCPDEGGEYKAVVALTYADGRQYCFCLFAGANDQSAADDFYAMLGSLKLLK
ncbi:MAG: hypothetical protein LBO03_01230 [Acidaminococcales bacterium]|jgi:hypothetical protein|nr:hypothetical protein [Acidaminococcales bacterium]